MLNRVAPGVEAGARDAFTELHEPSALLEILEKGREGRDVHWMGEYPAMRSAVA